MTVLHFPRDPSLLILAALAREDLHGYGIMKEVEAQSEGRARLALGTLYGALDRLVQTGAVEVAREERRGGRLRRYYHLTETGADSLRRELELQTRLIEITRSNLESRKPAIARPLEVS
jgi:DNA-binding PadR family transcriptional regulator